MAIQHRDAVARRRDLERLLLLERGQVAADAPEDLLRLRLQLVLLAGDVRHYIVHDVHAADTGVSGSRDGLHGDDGHGVDEAEPGLEGGEGDHEADDCAVAIAHQEPLVQPELLTLVRYQAEVVQVHRRHHERRQRVAAEVLGVGEDGDVGGLEGPLDVAGDVAVEAAEDDVAVGEQLGPALTHHQLAEGVAHGLGLLPVDGIAVPLAGGPRGGADGDELQVRVALQQEDESLADGARAAEDAWGRGTSVSPRAGGGVFSVAGRAAGVIPQFLIGNWVILTVARRN